MKKIYNSLRIAILSLLFAPSIMLAIHPEITPGKLLLKSGTQNTMHNFSESMKQSLDVSEMHNGRYYRIIQFNKLPDDKAKSEMEKAGLNFLAYIPHYAYIVSIPEWFDLSKLISYQPRTILQYLPAYKSSPAVLHNNIPDHAISVDGKAELKLMYFSDADLSLIFSELRKLNVNISEIHENVSLAHVIVPRKSIQALLALPFVFYLEEKDIKPEPDDTKGKSLHRSNVINSEMPMGRHYNGDGVSISLADDGAVGPHIDFTGRITQFMTSNGGSHGDMTAGIACGAGNLDPTKRGMADGAHIYIHDINAGADGYDHIHNSVNFYNNYGIVITSTSYSQSCNNYNTYSSLGDQLIRQNPQFSFVFSAGNRGQNDCGYGAGAPYGTITGGFKQGKNVIAVGNLDANGLVDNTSSRGPSMDGRVKPDICANGKDQNSTAANNTYQVGGGTSAACPGIAGISAQLYQAYKELNSGQEPESGLIKAAMMNSAEDLGNPQVDFTYGWGRVNALRAVETLEQNHYLLDSVSLAETNSHIINVPAGTTQLKCMVYWIDREGAPAANPALVNDLDMYLLDVSSDTSRPWILDPTPTVPALTAFAVRGIDRLNNVEQVTLDNPAAGNYTVNVNGFNVPFGPQRYYLVWEFRTGELIMTYPNGGEGFVPGEFELLRWDAQGNSGTFTLHYSVDNGTNWTQIVAGVPANTRQYNWLVPSAINSDRVLVRVTRGVVSDVADAPIAILGLPANINIDFTCATQMRLSWSAVTGASSYEVSMLGTKYMDSLVTTTSLSRVLPIADTVSTWFSVRAIGPFGGKGRRANAIRKTPGVQNCSFANDLALLSIQSPLAGTLIACQNLISVPVSLYIRNVGINPATAFNIQYTMNGGSPVVQTYNDTIAPGDSLLFTFPAGVNLSTPGTYSFAISINYTLDGNTSNNSQILTVLSQMTAVTPITEDFEGVFPPAGWKNVQSGTSFAWAAKSGIMGSGGGITTAAWFNNFGYNNPGAKDYLSTFLFDMDGISDGVVSFDVAYSQFLTSNDGLSLEVSTDCESTYIPTSYSRSGSTLATVAPVNNQWQPINPSDWRRDSVDLSAFANTLLFLRFVNTNDFGNSIYLDNVNIRSRTLGFNGEFVSPASVRLFPNPSAGLFNFEFQNAKSENVSFEVFDMQSRLVWKVEKMSENGNASAVIDLSSNGKGYYSLRVVSGEKSYFLKLIVL